jgi:serine/threonine protein kinase
VTVFDLGEEPPGPHPGPLPILGEGENDLSPGLSPTRGEEAKGQPYMVTELMGGGDVEGMIKQAQDHKLPLERAIAIAEQVCRGLEFAHGKGIVHRDLKPGNVWLTGDLTPGPFPSREGETGSPLSQAGEGQQLS